MSCHGCVQEAAERNREMNDLLIKAKKQAIEEKEPKAICYEPLQGHFITGAHVAYREGFQIKYIVSGL